MKDNLSNVRSSVLISGPDVSTMYSGVKWCEIRD